MWNALTEGGPVKPPSVAGGPCSPQGNQLHRPKKTVGTDALILMLHASMHASWRFCWARRSDVPILAKCIPLGLLISILTLFHRPPCSRTTCLLDIAWLGNLSGQGTVPAAGCMLPAWALTRSHLPVTKICHDMTGLAIMAGRLGAKMFCLASAGIACHGLPA